MEQIKTIKCRHCNKPLGSAIQTCSCKKKIKWNGTRTNGIINRAKHKLRVK